MSPLSLPSLTLLDGGKVQLRTRQEQGGDSLKAHLETEETDTAAALFHLFIYFFWKFVGAASQKEKKKKKEAKVKMPSILLNFLKTNINS